jgi:putative PIN family toxin of toxin-antitoxin system
MPIVFDTNVFVSAALGSEACKKAFELAKNKDKLARSEETFTELAVTLEKSRLQKYFRQQDKIDFLANYLLITERHEISVERLSVCRDPKDNMFLELALSCKASHIVTRDIDLLSLSPFREVTILSPEQFIKMYS